MRTAQLGDHVEILSGFAFKSDRFNDEGRGLPLVRIRDVKPAISSTYYDGDFDERFMLSDGDLLVGMDGEFNCARWAGGRALLNQRVCRVRTASTALDEQYLFWFLPKALKEIEDKSNFVTVKHLSGKQINEIEIPLPPLEEQQRIAAILDQADDLRRKRRQALDRLSQLGQAIFHEMFGDPAVNPMGWPVGTIRDLLDEVKYGTSAKANTDYVGLPMLRMGNLTYDGNIDLSDLKHVELSDDEFDKYTTRLGDILFNRTNSKELVGKTAVVTQEEPLAIAGYLVRARTNALGNPHYISAYLNSAHAKITLRNMCKNIVGMANINAQEFQNIAIAIPPKARQDDFAARISSIATARMPMVFSEAKIASIFISLQHRAFRGEL